MTSTIHEDLIGAEIKYYSTAKYRTRVIEWVSERIPLILMHGGGGHAEAYSRNIARLSRVCSPTALDFLWHGLSSRPKYWEGSRREGRHWLNQFTDQVLDLMDAKGIDKAVFEGESLGGWIAVDLGVNHPDRVAGLILNTAWGITLDPRFVKESKGDLEALRRTSLDALEAPTPEKIRRRMEWLMPLGGTTDEIVEVRRKIWQIPETRDALTEYYNRLFSASTAEALFNEEDLKRIRSKSLVLWTDHNPLHGVDAAERIAALMPSATLEIIRGAGHWPQWEKPEEHDAVVGAFLKALT